jgi:anti-anti-sigma factor
MFDTSARMCGDSTLNLSGGNMEIIVSEEQGRVPVTVFHIHGELTADTSDKFTAQAAAAIAGGTRNLLLDLSDVSFVGSYGIRALSSLLSDLYKANGLTDEDARKVLRSGGKAPYLKLLKPNQYVTKVLETSGMDMLLETHTDIKRAVASFS